MPLADLIYDVGLHRGEDTAFYLALGYRVVAFEANPELVAHSRTRFVKELEDGRLAIVEGAIADTTATTVTFYTHPLSVWGTTSPGWVSRNEALGQSTPITVPVVDFASVLRVQGIPYYLKIDIEGADRVCLQALAAFDDRPTYVSLEAEKSNWKALEEELDLLESLDYNEFAAVQQATIPRTVVSVQTLAGECLQYQFEPDASGGFGELISPWMTRQEALRRYRRIFIAERLLGSESLLRKTKIGRTLRGRTERLFGHPLPGWHDTHARRSVFV